MSCVITYKGNKYTQEQFKEYISSNKNEFSHIIASNKNVIDSFKRKMEGIDYVFSQSPELASIGSKAQYLQYLSTIFKTSKVKDIVYHGRTTKFDNFDDSFLGQKDPGYKGRGFYFWKGVKALDGARHVAFAYLNRPITNDDIVAALINLQNPKKVVSGDYSNTGKNLEEFDGAIEVPYSSEKIKPREKATSEVMVKGASQIHILGSKQDIEGFKQFVGNKEEITQDSNSFYRGQIEKPTIDQNGNLILHGKKDSLYTKAGLKDTGISMTDSLQSAIEYGNGQLEVAKNLASETYDAEQELETLSQNGYWLIQIPKNISNEIVKEAGEVKVIGDKIIVPKGKYKVEQVSDFLQKGNSTTESPIKELESKLMSFLNKIGVKVETLGEGDFVAKAKLAERIIQVVQGKADATTLPEEASHIFIDILKANGSLFEKLMNEIESNPIYQEVYAEYSTIYLTPSGKPDVEKIKEEAIGKLLARNIVKIHKADSQRSLLQRALDMIAAIIRKGLNAVGVTSFSRDILKAEGNVVYEKMARKILSSDVSDLKLGMPTSSYELLQASNTTSRQLVDNIRLSQNNISNAKNKKEGVETVHFYTVFEGTDKAKDIYGTPSTLAGKEGRKKYGGRAVSEKTQALWEKIRNRGTKVHSWTEEMIKHYTSGSSHTAIYDKLSESDKKLYNKVAKDIKSLVEAIRKEDPDATFLPEVRLYDPNFIWTDDKGVKHKGLAGSIDLLVVHGSKVGEGVVSIYDWKTTSKGKDLDAISIFKMYEYNMQIALYKRMLMNGNPAMGIPKIKGVYKSRLLQIHTKADIDGNLTEVELVGEIPVAGESTKIPELDAKLNGMYERFYNLIKTKPPSDENERKRFYDRISSLKDTIVQLHLRKNYNTVIENSESDFEYLNNLTGKEDITLDEIAVADEMIALYTDLLEYADREGMTTDMISELRRVEDEAKQFATTFKNKKIEILQSLADTYKVGNLLTVQNQIGFLAKNFTSMSEQNHPALALLDEILKRALYQNEIDSRALRTKIQEESTKLKTWASSKGKSLQQAYDMIINKKTGHLISMLSSEYYTQRKKALVDDDTKWFSDNFELDVERYEAGLAKHKEYVEKKKWHPNSKLNAEKKQEAIAEWISMNKNLMTSKYARIKKAKLSKWQSAEWQNLERPENKPLKDFYEFYTETTKEMSTWLPSFGYKNNFIPSLRKTWIEEVKKIDGKTAGSLFQKLKESYTITPLNTNINEATGEIGGQIPVYFINDLGSDKSFDLGMTLQLFGEMAYNYKNMSDVESTAKAGLDVLKGMSAYASSSFNPLGIKFNPITQEGKATMEANAPAIEMYKGFMDYYIYGIKTANPSTTTQSLEKLNRITSHTLLGLSIFPALAATIANIANTQIQIRRNIYFSNKHYSKAAWMLSGGSVDKNTRDKVAYLSQLFNPQIDQREQAKNRKLSTSIATKHLSTDILYLMLRKPDEINQNLVFLSMLQNSTFDKDGKIVLLSDYAKKLRPDNYYSLPKGGTERKAIDAKIKEQMKSVKSVMDMVTIKDGKAYIDGKTELDSEVVFAFRQMVKQVNKSIIGNMDPNDTYLFKANVWMRSLMLFRNWMPRAIRERYGSLRYNRELGRIEKGRYTTFFEMLKLSKDVSGKLRWNMLVGIEGVAKMEYVKALAKNPQLMENVTEAEFIDMYKENMKSQWTGLGITIAVLMLGYLLADYYDDDDDSLQPGEKFNMKLMNRAFSELAMFANPIEALIILKSPSAATTVPVTVFNLFKHLIKEAYGQITNDTEMTSSATPFKYFLNLTYLSGPSRAAAILDDIYDDWLNDENEFNDSKE